MQTRQLHALVFPFPLQGHISPLLHLSQYLASSHGFLITFVNTEHNHASFINKANKKQQHENTRINMVGLSDGLPLDAERKPSNLSNLVQSMPLHMTPYLQQIISESNQTSSPITCVIADLFLPWMHDLAKLADVPVFIGFHASSIAQFSSLYHIPLLVSSGQLNPDGSANVEKVMGIPGVMDISVSTYPWITGDPILKDATFKALASVHDYAEQLDAVIFNSFTELEKETVEALALDSKTKMLPIGPTLLLNDTGRDDAVSVDFMSPQDKECLDWLDSKSKGSVLYIAFGTTAWLDMKELHALALGIEASQVTFLWVLRSDLLIGESACLPEGFLERTKEHAHFTSWAPQPLVLSHPSIGGYLTHGGWNSALEAICNGVPMLTWPDFWDQRMHCEQVVGDWKVGLPLRRSDGKVVEQEEVEKLVRCLMSGKLEGKHLKERVATLKNKANLALAKGSGSSYNNIQQVVQLVEKKSKMQREK